MADDKLSVRIYVTKVGETQEVGANAFKKREIFGREENVQYPQDRKFEFIQDKTALLDNVLEGTSVTIHYNLKSRKVVKEDGTDMYFLNAQGWKIDV